MRDEELLHYRAMIWKHVRRYWPMLPDQAKTFYDPEDMYADVLLYVIRSVRVRYRRERGSLSTFVYQVARSQCCNILAQHSAQKRRAACVVPLAENHRIVADSMRLGESIAAFERLLEDASDELRQTVSDWLWSGRRTISSRCLNELRRLVHRHGLRRQQMELVLGII